MSEADEKADEEPNEESGGIASFDVGFGTGATAAAAPVEDADRPTFRVGVVCELSPRAEFATAASPARPPRGVDRSTFDEVMDELAPELAIDVTNPHDLRGKPLRVDLRFAKLRDFRPEVLAQQVTLLRSLRGAADAPTQAPRAEPAGEKSLLESLLDADPATPPPAEPARAEPAFARALREILQHPEVRRLEGAWRGLRWLVDRAAGEGASISFVSADGDGVLAAIAALAAGDEPLGLLMADHTLGATPRELARMESWAEAAEAVGVPLVVNGTPALLGFDDMASLARTQRRLRSSEDPRAAALRAVAARDAARWLTLAMNRLVARPRHTAESARSGVVFTEDEELTMGAAWGVAALAAASFARCGWPCALTGPREGRLDALHVRTEGEGRAQVTLALEALVREDVASEAAGAGVAMLCCHENQDIATLPFAPVLFRGPVGASGTSAAASTTLGDQLFVARVGQAVLQLASALPRDTPAAAVAEVAQVVLGELFGGHAVGLELAVAGEPPVLEVTVRPRGFLRLRLEEATLAARLA